MTVNIEAILKKELEQVIFQSLLIKSPDESEEKLTTVATLLSWMIYGASLDWEQNSNKTPEEYLEFASSSFQQLFKNE